MNPWWHGIAGIAHYLVGPKADIPEQVFRLRTCLACEESHRTRETWLATFRSWFFSDAPVAGWCRDCKCLLYAQSAANDPVHATITIEGKTVNVHAAGKTVPAACQCTKGKW